MIKIWNCIKILPLLHDLFFFNYKLQLLVHHLDYITLDAVKDLKKFLHTKNSNIFLWKIQVTCFKIMIVF
jgi:hypothetical protein